MEARGQYNMTLDEDVAIRFADSLYELRALIRASKKKRTKEESVLAVAKELSEMFRGPGEEDQTDISLFEELISKTKNLLAVKSNTDEDEDV